MTTPKRRSSDLDPNADLSQQSIVVSNYEGYQPENLPKRFEAETGATAEVTYHATNEEIVAKVTGGGDPGIDVAFVAGPYAQALPSKDCSSPSTQS